jgi:hypothetical protein
MVSPEFLPGETLPAEKLQMLGNIDQSFIPTLTAGAVNPGLGAASESQAFVWLNGQRVDVWSKIQFGTSGTSSGLGTFYLPVPTAYRSIAGMFAETPIGTFRFMQGSGGATRSGFVNLGTGGLLAYMVDGVTGALITSTFPWAWGVSDRLLTHYSYLTDFGL